MTYPLPAERQMFSDVRCHQPICIPVQEATDSAYPLSRADDLFASAGERWSLSVVMSLFLALSSGGALSILDASFKFVRSSYLVARYPWQPCARNRESFSRYLVFFFFSTGACWGSVSAFRTMRRRNVLRSRFVRVVVISQQKWVGVSERTRCKGSSRFVRTMSRLRAQVPRSISVECLCCSWILQRGSWWHTMVSSGVKTLPWLDQFSLLCGTQKANTPRRLLILTDNIALVLALCEGARKSHVAFRHASNLCGWYRCTFRLFFRCMPSELNYSDKAVASLTQIMTRASLSSKPSRSTCRVFLDHQTDRLDRPR